MAECGLAATVVTLADEGTVTTEAGTVTLVPAWWWSLTVPSSAALRA